MEKTIVFNRILGILAFSLIIGGCASGSAPKGVSTAMEKPSSVAGGEVDDAYRIGPGDTLQIFVWRNPDLTTSVPVRPDGRISTPLVKEMKAVGKTPEQLGSDIETALSQYVKNPVVSIIVSGFVGTFGDQIRVIGQAAEPKALPYRENITLLDVMIEVGGLTEFAAGNRAKIIRRIDGEQREIKARIEDLIDDGDISANVLMRPGDVLIIPESWL